MKNFKGRKTSSFILNGSMNKMFQKVMAMKKIFNQCYLGLKQPKNGTFKPFFSVLTTFDIFQIKGVSGVAIEFLR